MSKIARRKFLQLSAVAAAGYFVQPGREAHAGDLPQLTEDDPMAKAMKYTHDASTVDAASRNNPAADQDCANCALSRAPTVTHGVLARFSRARQSMLPAGVQYGRRKPDRGT